MQNNYWVTGRLVSAGDPDLPDRLLTLPGCYTTARVTDGRAMWARYHCRRLRRDARALGIGEPDDAVVLRAFAELGRAEFGTGTGVIRLQASRDVEGRLQLVATPRAVGPEPTSWRAIIAPFHHPGPGPHSGAKQAHQSIYEDARALSRRADTDETLLFDAEGRLVEGARSNLLIVTPGGELLTPGLDLGAVAGVALEVVRERVPEISAAELDEAHVRTAVEIIAINAVRGARAIVTLNGRNVASGQRGAWTRRLREVLNEAVK